MGWFSANEVVANNTNNTEVQTSVEQILIAVSVVLIAIIVVTYFLVKTCNKILSSRVSTAARREVELNRLNNGTVRV